MGWRVVGESRCVDGTAGPSRPQFQLPVPPLPLPTSSQPPPRPPRNPTPPGNPPPRPPPPAPPPRKPRKPTHRPPTASAQNRQSPTTANRQRHPPHTPTQQHQIRIHIPTSTFSSARPHPIPTQRVDMHRLLVCCIGTPPRGGFALRTAAAFSFVLSCLLSFLLVLALVLGAQVWTSEASGLRVVLCRCVSQCGSNRRCTTNNRRPSLLQ